jgi:spore photoproduct lyase
MEPVLEHVTRKSMLIRSSGRSTDFISPSIAFGCGFNCTYCTCKRHRPEGITVATNLGDIVTAINNHAMFAVVDKPNQTHESLISYDIGCNFDLPLHAKHFDWKYIFNFFKEHPRAMGSFATKYVNKNLLEYNPEGKIRIRFSLMPQCYADLLEPNTTPILNRMEAINSFIEAGYDVHVNFSPVIYEKNWTDAYKELFIQLDHAVKPEYKDKVKAEVIFLTHNEQKHWFNLKHDIPGEHLLWRPEIQENKISEYGGENIRYKHGLKAGYIKQFVSLHDEIIGWNPIRYIF